MQYYYEIEEAWKLYVREGVVKAESLNPSLLKMWEISKMRGANYDKSHLNLETHSDFKPALCLDKELESYINQQRLTLLLINEAYYVEDSCGQYLENISFPIGTELNIKETGFLALHMASQTKEVAFLRYSENYIRALHDYETLSFSISIDGVKYYVFILNKFSSLSESEIKTLMLQLSGFKQRYEKAKEEKGYLLEDYITLFELSPQGIIINRLSNTYLNKYFEKYTKLDESFSNFDLAQILSGEKQILVSKSEKEKKFMLSPIQWKSKDSILCQAEELELSYRAFLEVEKNYDLMNFSSFYPLNLQKKIASLLRSGYPCFVLYSDFGHLAYITSIIMEFTTKKAFNLNYEKSDDYVNSLCELKMAEKRAYIHDFTDIIYNIYIKELKMEQSKRLIQGLHSAFRSKQMPYKLVFYLKRDEYEGLKEKSIGNSDLIELQTIDFTGSVIPELLNYQFQFNVEKNKDELSKINRLRAEKAINLAPISERENFYKERTQDISYKIKDLEKQGIMDALIASNFNVTRASKMLGLSRASIYRKMKHYGIKVHSPNNVSK